MKKILAISIFVFASLARAQVSNPSIVIVASPPSGSCTAGLPWQYAISNGTGWYCGSVSGGTGTWTQIGSAAGSGTVSAGTATQVTYYESSGTTVDGAAHFLTNGVHQAMGANAAIDTTDSNYVASTVTTIDEQSATTEGTNGLFTRIDWSPTVTASEDAWPGAGIFEMNVDMDGQGQTDIGPTALVVQANNNGNTIPAPGLDGLVAGATVVGNSGGSASGAQFNATANGTGFVQDLIGTASNANVNAGTNAEASAFEGGVAASGGTIDNWLADFWADGGDQTISGTTVPEYDGFYYDRSPHLSGDGAITVNTGIHLGAVTGGASNYQILSDGTAPSKFAGPIQAPTITSSTTLALTSAAGTNITLSPGTTGITTVSSAPSANGSSPFTITNNVAGGNQYNGIFAGYVPNVASTNFVQFQWGQSAASKDSVAWNFYFSGNNSNSNYADLQFYGGSPILTCYPTLSCTFGGAINPPVARKGTFVCTAAGTITISNTNEAITSDVIISLNTAGGTITTSPAMKTVTAGTGFTVLCGASDTSTYNYDILN